jgi:hypothetical protein
MRILIFSFITLIFISSLALAEELLPGETHFEILGIILEPNPPPYEDFTGTSQTLVLYGDPSYLNVKWNAHYSDNVDRYIGVECYLNCLNPGKDIQNNCIAQKIPTNYCNYTSKAGYGFCTIVKPDYLFKNQLNNITCRFYDPSNPEMKYLPYPNRTFYPIYFDIFTTSETSTTVGGRFNLALNVRNLGLFVNNFTTNVSVGSGTSDPSLVIIESPTLSTSQLTYNKIGKMYPKIVFLSSGKFNIKVLTKAVIDPSTCDLGCASGYECVDNQCWKLNIIKIGSENYNLPEFGWTGIIQIILLSSILILI